MRAFLSVNLDPGLLGEISDIQERLKIIDGIKWVAPERMHITLQFLGEITQNQVIEIENALRRPAGQLSPFSISFRGIGAFPNVKKPRVIWLGIEEGKSKLRDIHKMIQDNLSFFEKDTRFSPHVTLGRSKKDARLVSDETVFSADISCRNKQYVDRFYLMKSTLYPSGPVYKPLKEIFLNQ